jgi:uncharacterized protein (TIGR03086 family)
MTTTPDPRTHLRRAFDQASSVVAGVTPQQLSDSTPCTEFDVTALLGHLVGVGYRVAEVGRGSSTGDLAVPSDVAADGWLAAFETGRREAAGVWADDEILGRKLELPFGTFDGATTALIYTLELTVHAWDLAAATGQQSLLNPALAEVSLPLAEQMVPADVRGGEMPFEAVVPVAEDAPPYDRLVGYLGRQPV